MTDTTDFEIWISENDPDGIEEIYALYQAVNIRESYGFWDVTTSGDKTFIKGSQGTLQLFSEKAREAFLVRVNELRGDPDMDIESWYGFHRAIARDD